MGGRVQHGARGATDIGADRGLLAGAEPAEMAGVFLGMLAGGGFLVRRLMRVAGPPTETEMRQRAKSAVQILFRAYGEMEQRRRWLTAWSLRGYFPRLPDRWRRSSAVQQGRS